MKAISPPFRAHAATSGLVLLLLTLASALGACQSRNGIDQQLLNNNASGPDRDATRVKPDTQWVDSLKISPAKEQQMQKVLTTDTLDAY